MAFTEETNFVISLDSQGGYENYHISSYAPSQVVDKYQKCIFQFLFWSITFRG